MASLTINFTISNQDIMNGFQFCLFFFEPDREKKIAYNAYYNLLPYNLFNGGFTSFKYAKKIKIAIFYRCFCYKMYSEQKSVLQMNVMAVSV